MFKVSNPAEFDASPELGMGFHFGVANTGGYLGPEGFIVLNSEIALSQTEIGKPRVFLSEPKETIDIRPSDDIELFIEFFGRWFSNPELFRERTKLHASPPFMLTLAGPQQFLRFSAFANDRRVQSNGSLLAGTYVTSKLDAALATTGYGVVGRYALPNMMPANNRFDISVSPPTAGLVGTVAPAFGQAGGGVEVELTAGAPLGAVTSSSTIPEY